MIIIYIIGSLLLFWSLYLAVMNLYVSYHLGKIPKIMLPISYTILAIGAVVDCIMNFSLFALIFLDIPREILVTQRLKRMIKSGVGWRLKLAQWICSNVLNPFTQGDKHCG